MCKLALFFEGGIQYEYLKQIPLSEFNELVSHANKINAERKREMNRISR